jgi:DNA-directed RNA polymerase alpha subunit
MQKEYRVKPGYRHGVRGKYGPGDIVKLTPGEAEGFLDKLELVETDGAFDEIAETLRDDEARIENYLNDAVSYYPVEPLLLTEVMKSTAINALVRAGYDTAEKVANTPDDKLLKVPGVGQRTIASLREKLEAMGLDG